MTTIRSSSGKITTFYSYKGGTGRSMALANVACLLAQGDKKAKILMIDWDLEAPGLHRYFQNNIDAQGNKPFSFDTSPGLIDLFYDMRRLCEQNKLDQDEITDNFFDEIGFDKYLIKTSLQSLYLMTAGKLDKAYASRVNSFNWQEFFSLYPSLIYNLAEYISKKFKNIFIDSRTGHTDISGICTALMPDKLVVVFTPNQQSISGVIDITRMAIEYRKQSDDLRKLLVFPLVSRVEPAEPQLRKEWRFGNQSKKILGYQHEFQNLFKDLYKLEICDLTSYFDDVQIQYIPRYAYGEEVAVLAERSEDRLSLARSYEGFVKQLFEKDRPWDSFKQEEPILSDQNLKISDYESAVEVLLEIINLYQQGDLDQYSSDEISSTIRILQEIQSVISSDDAAAVLSGLLSTITSHLYVARGYATPDVPRDITYYKSMSSVRNEFLSIGRLRLPVKKRAKH